MLIVGCDENELLCQNIQYYKNQPGTFIWYLKREQNYFLKKKHS